MNTQQDYGWLVESGLHRVELVDIGEGVNGDYDPTNPADEPMLCINVMKKAESGQWIVVDEAFCRTLLPVTASVEQRQCVLENALAQVLQSGKPTLDDLPSFASTTPGRKASGLSI